MDAKGIAFLRALGMPDEALVIVADAPDTQWTITPEILTDWLRFVYIAGKRGIHEPYAWYSVEELMARPLA